MRQHWRLLALAALLPLLSPSAAAQDCGTERVAVLGGSITEIVYALGCASTLAAVDLSSIYPAEARGLPQMGYFRQVSAEGVLSMNPTLVLALEGAGPPTALQQIEAAGVQVTPVAAPPTLEGARAKIETVAAAIGAEAAGTQLLAQWDADLTAVQARIAQATNAPRVVFIYARGGGTLNVSGTGTTGDAMIALAGATNAITAYEGFRPLTAEALVAAAPDVILVLDRGLQTMGGRAGLMRLPGVALTPAGREGRIVSMEDSLFLNFGPRLGEALDTLHRLLFAPTP